MQLDTSYANIIRLSITVIAVAMGLYHIYAIAFGSPEAIMYRGTHLIFVLVLTFLCLRATKAAQGQLPGVLDFVLLAVAITPILYLFINYEYVVTRIYYIDEMSMLDMTMAVVLIVMIMEATRRVIGWTLPLTAIVFLIYGIFFAGLEPMRLLDQLYMTTEGIFGIPLSVSAAYVLIFVLFGAFMERTGTGQLIMDFALALTGHTAGGPGKVSVFSSSLFGTISGSAVANVMVDGPIAIPLMKRAGFPPHFAAGVESTASTGGQIMPPVMGAAAFVMAEFLGVGYGQVLIWALIPAILYYVACFSAVHFEAKRRGLVGLPRSELPRVTVVLGERGHLFLPIPVILFVMYLGYSAPMAALVATLSCFPMAALRASTRVNVTFENVVEAFVDGAKNALAVATACACAGIVIGVVMLSGIGIVFTQFVVSLAQDFLLPALILTMIASIIVGMGMPTTPAYIIMTALMVPAIIKLGVIAPAAHMFALYFAVLSAITPPVALAVFAAAGIAKSDILRSCLAAMKIGAAGFIVPFMFVYEPALLMIDAEWPYILYRFTFACVGIALFAGGLHGYFLTHASMPQRLLLVSGGFLLIAPSIYADISGVVVAGAVLAWQFATRRAELAAAAPAAAPVTATPVAATPQGPAPDQRPAE